MKLTRIGLFGLAVSNFFGLANAEDDLDEAMIEALEDYNGK
jgi:hypothetical protein